MIGGFCVLVKKCFSKVRKIFLLFKKLKLCFDIQVLNPPGIDFPACCEIEVPFFAPYGCPAFPRFHTDLPYMGLFPDSVHQRSANFFYIGAGSRCFQRREPCTLSPVLSAALATCWGMNVAGLQKNFIYGCWDRNFIKLPRMSQNITLWIMFATI